MQSIDARKDADRTRTDAEGMHLHFFRVVLHKVSVSRRANVLHWQ